MDNAGHAANKGMPLHQFETACDAVVKQRL